jgi:large subunit ribosomal protein L29
MSKRVALIEEMRQMGDAELIDRLAEARKELFNLRFQQATGQLDNVARLPNVKREIARAETLLREREIAAHEALLKASQA